MSAQASMVGQNRGPRASPPRSVMPPTKTRIVIPRPIDATTGISSRSRYGRFFSRTRSSGWSPGRSAVPAEEPIVEPDVEPVVEPVVKPEVSVGDTISPAWTSRARSRGRSALPRPG
ncbi:hypothetical protein ACFFX0_11140 [Citricoccus parietis]|uniref:Uncharacterized protein n=1 Tax=Citricoccus parietis TaxID=592307 RepID=A0ABV5FYH1_9MICC